MQHLLLTFLLLPASQHSPSWETVNLNSSGALSTGDGGAARMSDDARFVVFETLGTNFGVTDTNGSYDVYLRDRLLGTTELISVAPGGATGNARSRWPTVSDNGRFVVFHSEATDLVAGDTNGFTDLFLRDRLLGFTERVSVGSGGLQATGAVVGGDHAAISDDGNFIAFSTYAGNLSLFDADGYSDVYRRDRSGNLTTLVSVNYLGSDNTRGFHPSMSSDGTYVAYDTNGLATLLSGGSWLQCYKRHMGSGVNTLISLSPITGFEGSGNSEYPEISDDGSVVAFTSKAWDLVGSDLNSTAPDAFLSVAGTVEMVSLDESDAQSNLGVSPRAHCSDDGRFVVFHCSPSQVAGFSGSAHFLRDRVAGTTELVEVPFAWTAVHPTLFSYGARLNSDGTKILLGVAAYIPGATGAYNVVMRKRTAGQDGIFLTGSTYGSVGGSVSFSGAHAPKGTPFYLLRSMKQTGIHYAGHGFDVGSGAAIFGSGVTTASGSLSISAGPLPAFLSGKTFYVEAAASAGGVWHDSNLLWVEVL